MSDFRFTSRLEQSRDELRRWHHRPGAFVRLVPPWERIELLEPVDKSTISEGGVAKLAMPIGPLRLRWDALHSEVDDDGFVDEQLRGPFSRFRHRHRFVEVDHGAELVDDIELALPLGLPASWVGPRLQRTFRYRHTITQGDMNAHARWSTEPLDFVVTGASGLVGKSLSAYLTTGGHRVRTLGRGAGADIRWSLDQADAKSLAQQLEGADVIVHLAGEPVAGGRWSAAKKARILQSRERSTRLLADAIATIDEDKRPSTFVCASAIGYYGDRGQEQLDEDSALGEGFLAEVCERWERACSPLDDAGVRVVNLRIGVVLSARGGALEKMIPLFKLGLGGRVGDAAARMPVIALDDLLDIILHASVDERLRGPVNAVSHSVRQDEFAREMNRALGRPGFLPVPKSLMRLALGKEQADGMLLSSAWVRPTRLLEVDHPFRHESLASILAHELGAKP